MSYIDHYGYKHILASDCSRVHKDGYAKLHIVIAERTLGKPLPSQAVVHHFDEDKLNNDRTNLVICEDDKYHRILHARKRVLDAGADPNTHKMCHICQLPVIMKNFYYKNGTYDGLRGDCITCASKRLRGKKYL